MAWTADICHVVMQWHSCWFVPPRCLAHHRYAPRRQHSSLSCGPMRIDITHNSNSHSSQSLSCSRQYTSLLSYISSTMSSAQSCLWRLSSSAYIVSNTRYIRSSQSCTDRFVLIPIDLRLTGTAEVAPFLHYRTRSSHPSKCPVTYLAVFSTTNFRPDHAILDLIHIRAQHDYHDHQHDDYHGKHSFVIFLKKVDDYGPPFVCILRCPFYIFSPVHSITSFIHVSLGLPLFFVPLTLPSSI